MIKNNKWYEYNYQEATTGEYKLTLPKEMQVLSDSVNELIKDIVEHKVRYVTIYLTVILSVYILTR